MSKLWAALAPAGFRIETERELAHRKLRPVQTFEDFFLFEGEPVDLAWSAAVWRSVEKLSITSINDAVKKMRPLAKKWVHLESAHRGRGKLILENLREQKFAPLPFPSKLQLPEGTGAFTFLDDEKAVLWCRDFDRSHPLGVVEFLEDKSSPPSRAYLKLWEAFGVMGKWPSAGDSSMDLGSCPGGWTWVLASLRSEVLSVDRAPLEPGIAAMKGVTFKKGDAFQVLPGNTGPKDWLCSDVICAPEKLLELVSEWIEAGSAKHFICTLKFQGEADPRTVDRFRALGRVLHLHHNKHELTFLR